jgi:hypothetical protein
VPKKKAREDDPFASDDEEDKKQMLTKVNTGAKRPKESEGEDEDDGRPTKKKT